MSKEAILGFEEALAGRTLTYLLRRATFDACFPSAVRVALGR
jgi:hypothetical protein